MFLILPSVGATINALLIVIVQCTSPDYMWAYLVGAGLSGLTGFFVFNLSAYSYAADISNHGDHTQRMGWFEATTYASSFLSQLIGGVWIDAGICHALFWSDCLSSCDCRVSRPTIPSSSRKVQTVLTTPSGIW